MRFARKVDFNLKSGQEKEFGRIFEDKVVPILHKQKGFQDEFVLTSGRQVTAISLWDTRQNAEAYDKAAYHTVLDTLKPVLEATPKVQACDVAFAAHHAVV